MRITKKEREEAILWLELAADAWIRDNDNLLDRDFATTPELARRAEREVEMLLELPNPRGIRRIRLGGCIWLTPVDYLEAAALLRDGWCPGDPVELL